MVRILKKFNRKSTRRSRSKAAAIALTTNGIVGSGRIYRTEGRGGKRAV